MSVNNCNLYLNKESSDVTLVIDGTELPAHRSILSEESEYFKSMFYGSFVEADSEQVLLKETDLNTFKVVLEWIYTGSCDNDLTIGETFKLLTCARYFLVQKLVLLTMENLKSILTSKPIQVLNYAHMYSVDELIVLSTEAIKRKAPFKNIVDQDTFEQISPTTMEHLLTICLNIEELEIFNALVAWMRANPEHSSLFLKLLGCIDLYLLEEEWLEMLFKPEHFIDRESVKNLLNQQREQVQNIINKDETFFVDAFEFPANRSRVAQRSNYFKLMLSNNYVEPKFDKVTSKERKLNAFKVVLKYIYTGGKPDGIYYTMADCFKLLKCAQKYNVDSLIDELMLKIKWRGKTAPSELLNHALAYSIDDLVSYGTDFVLEKVHHLIDKKIFEQLSLEAVKHLLKIRVNAREIVVFKALVGWMRANPDQTALFPELLEYIDLYLIEKEHLQILFEPIQLIDPIFCQNLLDQQQEKASKVQKVVNKNVINGITDLRIVDGVMKKRKDLDLLALSVTDCVIIDLKQLFLLNCIKFKLVNDIGYIVSVSRDMYQWKCVSDHSEYVCFGQQILYFNERDVRFIRIQCEERYRYDFKIQADVEALYSTNHFEINPLTTIPIPKHNIIPTELTTTITHDSVGAFIQGELANGCIRHKIGTGSIVFNFAQPYIVDSLKLLLNEKSSYSVMIKTSGKRQIPRWHTLQKQPVYNWISIFAEENVTGWRIVTFEKQPISFIRIVGTNAPSEYFQLIKLECPAI